jgi:hypothetical protein
MAGWQDIFLIDILQTIVNIFLVLSDYLVSILRDKPDVY